MWGSSAPGSGHRTESVMVQGFTVVGFCVKGLGGVWVKGSRFSAVVQGG